MTREDSIRAIIAAADDGGTIQAPQMLDLCRRGALPSGVPDLHTSCSVAYALAFLGLTPAEIDAALDA